MRKMGANDGFFGLLAVRLYRRNYPLDQFDVRPLRSCTHSGGCAKTPSTTQIRAARLIDWGGRP